jgi:hypothetical protein
VGTGSREENASKKPERFDSDSIGAEQLQHRAAKADGQSVCQGGKRFAKGANGLPM